MDINWDDIEEFCSDCIMKNAGKCLCDDIVKYMSMKNDLYRVAEKLPPINTEVIAIDEDWNEFSCVYDGEYWFFNIGAIPVLCDAPKYWKYKNMED